MVKSSGARTPSGKRLCRSAVRLEMLLIAQEKSKSFSVSRMCLCSSGTNWLDWKRMIAHFGTQPKSIGSSRLSQVISVRVYSADAR